MAKIQFREIHLNKSNKERLRIINRIIEEYQKDGYVLTLRQLYYQLVTRDVIPNKQTEYSKLSTLLKEGRMSGIVDWEAIEDRLRKPEYPSSWENPKELMDSAIKQYALPRQKGQPIYLEVWVEKDALSGVLKRVTEQYHVPIMVNRGYSSVSAMYDAFNRFNEAFQNNQSIMILYLGDYDPSGIDMIRDIEDRILEFFVGNYQEEYGDVPYDLDFSVNPIALTRKQIDLYNPPPNPAKITDPRSKDFIAKYGNTSWEVDALRPDVLNTLLEDSIQSRLDMRLFNEVLLGEQEDIKKLKSIRTYL